jgi:hypothetical protein
MTGPEQPEGQQNQPWHGAGHAYVLGAAGQQPVPAQPGPPVQQQAQGQAGYPPAQTAPVAAPNTALVPATGRAGAATSATGTPTGLLATATRAQTAARAGTAPDTAVAIDSPEGPRHGTVYSSRRPFDALDGGVPSGRLPRLRIGSHMVTMGALAQLGVSSPGTGLILGADRDRRPVPVRFFRPEPTRISMVGTAWAARLVVFRALALGTRAVVMTGEPAAWQGFGEWATGYTDRVAVIPAEQQVSMLASAHQPALVVYDLGLVGPSAAPTLGPWQTQLTVLRRLDEPGVPSLQECHLVMLQRLTLVESALAASALQLSGQSTQLLQLMEDDMLALLGGGADRYVWLNQTNMEQQLSGAGR